MTDEEILNQYIRKRLGLNPRKLKNSMKNKIKKTMDFSVYKLSISILEVAKKVKEEKNNE